MEESLNKIIDNKFLIPMKDLKINILSNEEKIKNFFKSEILKDKNKERVLLNFRRMLEMVVNTPLFVTVVSKSSYYIIAVRGDNFLQLIDDRYYSPLQLSTFMDIFKMETNDFQKIGCIGVPHIKLIINYIQTHYNTTFRKFMNRNSEYYYMYKFFFDNGEKIKKVLNFLNAYHYNIEDNDLYEAKLENFQNDIIEIYQSLEEVFKKFEKKITI